MKLIAECSFDYQGKTYEYELIDTNAYHPEDGFIQITPSPSPGGSLFHNLYAITEKTVPFPELPSPKEFSVVRVQKIKPYSEKEFDGDLKKIHHLFFR